jgi:hypothetical protein
MNINSEILNTLQRLSKVNIDFLEFIKRNPESLRRRSYADLMKFNIGPNNIQPWSTFISPSVKKQLQEASTAVFHLVKQIPERLFDYNPQKISAYFGYPEMHIQLQLENIKDGHIENLLGRGDFIFSPSGLKCLECNISAGIGGWQLQFFEPSYLNNPIISKFIQEYQVKIYNKNQFIILFQHLLTTAKKKFPGDNHSEMNIGFALREYKKNPDLTVVEEQLNRLYQQVLKEQGSQWQGKFSFCDFSYLAVENDCIFFKGKRIHTLVEWYHGAVPPQFFYVSLLGNVLLYNGPITKLLSNKLNLALLSENEDTEVFTPEERENIKKYIPWTRRLVPGKVTFGTRVFNMEEFLNLHREKLVIKPDRELGGKYIQVGKFTGADQWKKVIENAFRDKDRNWLVQEYLEPSTHLYQYGENGYAEHQTIWGLFVFGTTYAGGFLRLIPKSESENFKGIINTHQGAKKTVLLEVDR